MKKRLVLLFSLVTAAPASAAPLDAEGWSALLAAHAGRPLIVHFWGMTCGPCRVELPEWGRFRQAHPDPPLLLVEADPVPIPAERAARELAEKGLGGTESQALAGLDDGLLYRIDPAWAGELPMTLLVGADGKTERRLTGSADFAEIGRWWAARGGAAP